MHHYKELTVWKMAIELADKTLEVTENLPSNHRFILASQMARCAISIPSNIAEGAGRDSDIEFMRFLSIANGSAFELETQLIIARNSGLVPDEQFESISGLNNQVQKMLFKLRKSIQEKTDKSKNSQ